MNSVVIVVTLFACASLSFADCDPNFSTASTIGDVKKKLACFAEENANLKQQLAKAKSAPGAQPSKPNSQPIYDALVGTWKGTWSAIPSGPAWGGAKATTMLVFYVRGQQLEAEELSEPYQTLQPERLSPPEFTGSVLSYYQAQCENFVQLKLTPVGQLRGRSFHAPSKDCKAHEDVPSYELSFSRATAP